jgi:hypothetical protein
MLSSAGILDMDHKTGLRVAFLSIVFCLSSLAASFALLTSIPSMPIWLGIILYPVVIVSAVAGAGWVAIKVAESERDAKSAEITEWEARNNRPWEEPSLSDKVALRCEAAGAIIGGLIVLALGLSLLAGVVALIAAFPIPIAILVGSLFIARAIIMKK